MWPNAPPIVRLSPPQPIAWEAWLSLNLYPRQPWLGLILPAITQEGQH
jgi:hypothetical protein